MCWGCLARGAQGPPSVAILIRTAPPLYVGGSIATLPTAIKYAIERLAEKYGRASRSLFLTCQRNLTLFYGPPVAVAQSLRYAALSRFSWIYRGVDR